MPKLVGKPRQEEMANTLLVLTAESLTILDERDITGSTVTWRAPAVLEISRAPTQRRLMEVLVPFPPA